MVTGPQSCKVTSFASMLPLAKNMYYVLVPWVNLNNIQISPLVLVNRKIIFACYGASTKFLIFCQGILRKYIDFM